MAPVVREEAGESADALVTVTAEVGHLPMVDDEVQALAESPGNPSACRASCPCGLICA